MAAVSQRHAAAPHGLPFSKSVRNLNQEPDKRNIDNPGFSSDYNDNSDAYSFEARSDVSDDRDGSAAAAAAASTRSGEAVRPDSLAMTSPLEQLTRSLSFNKKDSPSSVSSHGKMSSARLRQLQEKESGLPPVEQVMLEYLASEPTREAGLSTDAQLDIEGSDAMAYQPGFTKDQGQQLRSIGNASRKPVRSSEDSDQAGGAEDADTQGQLINAFRSSYHTYMTRSGGLRDSSYSWMAPDADSPNATMDFKQAGIPNSNEVENSRGLESYEAKFSGNDGLNESSDAYSQWEAEDDRAQARRSSWDSQAVRKMALHRVPSQKASKTLTDDRTSAPSVNEPFHYSSYESALRASDGAKQREQMRASNWTSLTNDTLPQDSSEDFQRLSAIEEGPQSPSVYAYAVDSPSVMQGSFAGPSRVASAVPMPRASRSQAGRTNFSRPHDAPHSANTNHYVQAREEAEQISNTSGAQHNYAQQDRSHLPYANNDAGSVQTPRQPYDSVYSAYTQTSDVEIPRNMPRTLFGAADSRPHYSPSPSSQTTYTIQEMATSTRPNLRSLDSYAGSPRDIPPSGTAGQHAKTKRHKRTPSQILASAIAKHKSQRAAAGLTTEGQYYVDPKSKKYYFVADSGQPGGSALIKSKTKDGKESEKPKERRKLYKKEAGWEITKAGQPDKPGTVNPPHTPLQEQRDRSLSLSGRSASSARTSEEGHNSASKWKIWSSGRSQNSKEHLPQASPSQNSFGQRNAGRQHHEEPGDSSLELIAEVRALTSSTKTPSSPGTRFHHLFAEDPSPRTADPPTHSSTIQSATAPSQQGRLEKGSPHANVGMGTFAPQDDAGSYSAAYLQPPALSLGVPSLPSRPSNMERSNSVCSNYSYYGIPTDQGYISSARTSPVLDRSQVEPQAEHPTHAPLHSPYIAPTGAQFQPNSNSHARQPSATLDKAKHSISHSGSLQLLAPAQHQNLTVPKGDGSLELAELARRNPNDPLVCLHLGIDAHEKGELEDSARLFEKSAKGGCGLGMLMFGLSLRHGWGCISDPEAGFQYLQKAAESVVENLDRVISGHVQLSDQQIEEQSAKSELVLSIYELGQCFLRGWGVAKDKKTALQYFTLAANLGDPDAQSELGFCYSTGRGCKKDLKKAAKYYRMAAKQGQISYGMQWIYKSKYDD